MKWFRKTTPPDADGYYKTGIAADTLQPNVMQRITIGEETVIVTLGNAQQPVAFSAICPHAAADLGEGDLYRGKISCPDHEWQFDINTGRILYPADEACRLKRFAVKVKDQVVWIKVAPSPLNPPGGREDKTRGV